MRTDVLSAARGRVAILELVETESAEASREFAALTTEIARANKGQVTIANTAIAPMILPDENQPGSDDPVRLLLITNYETVEDAKIALSKREESGAEGARTSLRSYALKPLGRIESFMTRRVPYLLGLGRRVPLPHAENPEELRAEIEGALILGEQPDKERWVRLVERAGARPIWMLNFLDFAKAAVYAAQEPNATAHAPTSGAIAYRKYGSGMISSLGAVGGRVGWGGQMLGQLSGDDDGKWNQVAIAVYPSAAAMMTMLALPKYRAAHVHRAAALARTRLLATQPLEGQP